MFSFSRFCLALKDFVSFCQVLSYLCLFFISFYVDSNHYILHVKLKLKYGICDELLSFFPVRALSTTWLSYGLKKNKTTLKHFTFVKIDHTWYKCSQILHLTIKLYPHPNTTNPLGCLLSSNIQELRPSLGPSSLKNSRASTRASSMSVASKKHTDTHVYPNCQRKSLPSLTLLWSEQHSHLLCVVGSHFSLSFLIVVCCLKTDSWFFSVFSFSFCISLLHFDSEHLTLLIPYLNSPLHPISPSNSVTSLYSTQIKTSLSPWILINKYQDQAHRPGPWKFPVNRTRNESNQYNMTSSIDHPLEYFMILYHSTSTFYYGLILSTLTENPMSNSEFPLQIFKPLDLLGFSPTPEYSCQQYSGLHNLETSKVGINPLWDSTNSLTLKIFHLKYLIYGENKLLTNLTNKSRSLYMVWGYKINQHPGMTHWKQVIHIWNYVKGTRNLTLRLHPEEGSRNQNFSKRVGVINNCTTEDFSTEARPERKRIRMKHPECEHSILKIKSRNCSHLSSTTSTINSNQHIQKLQDTPHYNNPSLINSSSRATTSWVSKILLKNNCSAIIKEFLLLELTNLCLRTQNPKFITSTSISSTRVFRGTQDEVGFNFFRCSFHLLKNSYITFAHPIFIKIIFEFHNNVKNKNKNNVIHAQGCIFGEMIITHISYTHHFMTLIFFFYVMMALRTWIKAFLKLNKTHTTLPTNKNFSAAWISNNLTVQFMILLHLESGKRNKTLVWVSQWQRLEVQPNILCKPILSFSCSEDEPLLLPLSPKPVFKLLKFENYKRRIEKQTAPHKSTTHKLTNRNSTMRESATGERDETEQRKSTRASKWGRHRLVEWAWNEMRAAGYCVKFLTLAVSYGDRKYFQPSAKQSVQNHNMLYTIRLISPLGYSSNHCDCIIAKGFYYLGRENKSKDPRIRIRSSSYPRLPPCRMAQFPLDQKIFNIIYSWRDKRTNGPMDNRAGDPQNHINN
ncbi:hypothetical protein VP01_38g2 [Puccinia sorghi]|uniref:Uncharacterized protein n=1 Tax=Puccinia sorghi TaxID=27349 RepID=A0A0L6USP6_9BASI|nr:hypothetical protein VP01_38g2 [Puccinia sorghi]